MNIVRIGAALLVVIALGSCKKENIVHAGNFNRSFDRYLSFKDSTKNSYRYTVVSGSWTGSSWETKITVQNGKPVKRSFIYMAYTRTSPTVATVIGQWEEEGGQLSFHDKGAPIWTLDKVYLEAKNDWLLKRDKAQVYFEANNNGMISTAGYVMDGCQDDCFNGITITSIEAL